MYFKNMYNFPLKHLQKVSTVFDVFFKVTSYKQAEIKVTYDDKYVVSTPSTTLYWVIKATLARCDKIAHHHKHILTSVLIHTISLHKQNFNMICNINILATNIVKSN